MVKIGSPDIAEHVLFLERIKIYKQMADGIKFMHDNDYTHEDLKP